MSAPTTTHDRTVAAREPRATSATRAMARMELRLLLREPAVLFWGVAFPVLLLVILGVASSGSAPDPELGGRSLVSVYVPIVIGMSLAILGVSQLPHALAGYRERGVLRRLATTPVGPSRMLVAQASVIAVTAVLVLVAVLVVAALAFGVALPKAPLGFALAFVLTALSLAAIGLVIAAVARTEKAATAAGAAAFFPLMLFAGLWLPREYFPDALRTASDATPLGAGVQALQDAMSGSFPSLTALAVLTAWVLVFGVAAVRLFRWE